MRPHTRKRGEIVSLTGQMMQKTRRARFRSETEAAAVVVGSYFTIFLVLRVPPGWRKFGTCQECTVTTLSFKYCTKYNSISHLAVVRRTVALRNFSHQPNGE